MTTNTNNPIISGDYVMADAVAMIAKAHNTTFFVRGGTDLPIYDAEGNSVEKHFPGMTNIKVDRKSAMNYVKDMLRNLGERGARITISVHTTTECSTLNGKRYPDCMFIG